MEAPITDTAGPARDAVWVPDACTLPTADQPLRVAAFDELFAASLRDVDGYVAGSRQVRLVLVGDAALPARVQRLVDAEASCCSFFTFTLTRLDDAVAPAAASSVVALEVEVPAAHTGVLEALVRRAEAARPPVT